MAKYGIIHLFLLLCVSVAQAQDERLFRQMISGDLTRPLGQDEKSDYHYKVRTASYQFDVDDDGRPEQIYFSNKDGENWINLTNNEGKRFYKYKFEVKGVKARPLRILVRRLSKNTKVFIIQFYEGYTRYLDFQGTGRLYFLTIDNRDLGTLSMYKGPYFWDEVKEFKGHYHHRKQEISLYDFDRDGVREIAVRYHLTTRVFMYKNKGVWRQVDKG